MSSKEKLAMKKLVRFKRQNFDALLSELLSVKKRDMGDDGIQYEDIILDGRLVASFVYDGKTVSFKRYPGDARPCAAGSNSVAAETNTPQRS